MILLFNEKLEDLKTGGKVISLMTTENIFPSRLLTAEEQNKTVKRFKSVHNILGKESQLKA